MDQGGKWESKLGMNFDIIVLEVMNELKNSLAPETMTQEKIFFQKQELK